MNYSFVKTLTIISFSCAGIIACSNISDSQTNNKSKSSVKGQVQHIHPANKCMDAVVHSHPDGKKDHEHKHNCEGKVRSPSNAHTHPATKLTGPFRHVHPNGANKHSHHK